MLRAAQVAVQRNTPLLGVNLGRLGFLADLGQERFESELSALLAEFPYYATSQIPASFYPQAVNTTDATTMGVKATLVTSANVSEDVVYAITKEVFENFEEFSSLHPAYAVLTPQNMLEGLSAPLHPGAVRYYEEAGMLGMIDPALLP